MRIKSQKPWSLRSKHIPLTAQELPKSMRGRMLDDTKRGGTIHRGGRGKDPESNYIVVVTLKPAKLKG